MPLRIPRESNQNQRIMEFPNENEKITFLLSRNRFELLKSITFYELVCLSPASVDVISWWGTHINISFLSPWRVVPYNRAKAGNISDRLYLCYRIRFPLRKREVISSRDFRIKSKEEKNFLIFASQWLCSNCWEPFLITIILWSHWLETSLLAFHWNSASNSGASSRFNNNQSAFGFSVTFHSILMGAFKFLNPFSSLSENVHFWRGDHDGRFMQ